MAIDAVTALRRVFVTTVRAQLQRLVA